MNSVFKPFRLKVFLMFIGSVFILYLVNSDMISFVGKNELTNIYIDKVSMVNNAWNEKNFNEIDPNELKKEIVDRIFWGTAGDIEAYIINDDANRWYYHEEDWIGIRKEIMEILA